MANLNKQGFIDIDPNTLTEQELFLLYQTMKGYKWRYDNDPEYSEEYKRDVIIPRFKKELNTIIGKKYTEYFLNLQDITNFCRNNDIPLGPARGSAGGSIVSYALGISNVEPLRFNLIFERFLNPERNSPPDIDTDVSWARRQEVIDYITRKHGKEHVSQIMTFGTLSLKVLLDDLGRVYNIPRADIERVKKSIQGDAEKATFAKAIEQEGFRHEWNELIRREPRIEDAVAKLEGLHRHTSIHAGGVVIATDEIMDLAPTYYASGKGRQIVQYEMADAEAVGLLKLDLLGLRTVTHLDWAKKMIQKNYDPNFDWDLKKLDDQAVFDIINAGNTAGIFQLEGTGITKFAQDMHIDKFEDIIALMALYRPGTLDSGSAYQYIKRKNGKEPITYPHPDLEPILKETYGIIVYQEQVMEIFRVMAGYSWGQADMARKAMGKKKKEIMDAELEKFKAGARSKGYNEEDIEKIAHLIETFARYGFNKSHAVAYAYLVYWTAQAKARFPECFYSAWLNITDASDKKSWIIDHLIRDGIQIVPPNINKSDAQFAMVDRNVISFGLQAVKGLGDKMVAQIITNRQLGGDFKDYADFCVRCTSIAVDKKEALIKAGAFDFDPLGRGVLLQNARIINTLAKAGKDFSEKLVEPETPLTDLQMAEMEKEIVNFYITMNPLTAIREEIEMLGGTIGIPIENLSSEPLVGGRITNVHKHVIKKKGKNEGKEMAFVEVDDGSMVYDVSVFPDDLVRYGGDLVKDKMVAIKCQKSTFGGKQTLSCKEVFQINIEHRQYKSIRVNVGEPTNMSIARLKMILDKAEQGKTIIEIQMIEGGYEFVMQSRVYTIKVTNDIIDELKTVFGEQSVTMRR